MEISVTQQVLLYLLNCAVNERVPEELPEELDFEELYKLSRFHSVSAMVSYALDKGKYLTEAYMSQEMIQKWAAARIGAIRKNLMFDAEREQILQWMEEVGCWYMPLKGVILKDMYPDVGMREMCDNDILFDKEFRNQLREFMISRGYKVESFQVYVDDDYMKLPFYNFECHTELFNDVMLPEWASYYANIKERLRKDDDYRFSYQFSDEDFYIFFIAHAAKHYRRSGTGIRFLTDQYIFLKQKEASIDYRYIENELRKLGIEEFEKEAKILTKIVLDRNVGFKEMCMFSEEEKRMLSYLIHSGTYGTISNQLKQDLTSIQDGEDSISFMTKIKYLFQRIFPGKDHMKKHEPFIYKHQWLIPFFWIYRILIRAPFMKSKRILSEFKAIVKVK